MIGRAAFTTLLFVGLLAGCKTPPPEAYVGGTAKAAAASAVPIGQNEAGEPCRYQPGGGAAGRTATVYCGDWDQPSGRVSELAGTPDAAGLAAAAQSGPWRAEINQHFDCGRPVATHILGNAPAELMQCTRRVGGWPQIAMVAAVGGRLLAADAVRPALSAVEATMAAMTGQAPAVAAALGSSEARRLIAERGGGASFGSGDEGRFYQQLRLGDAYNNINEPVNAERAYREALAIQEKILGPDNPGLALTLMKLAGQLAHQGEGAEAERLLVRAEQLIAKRPDPLLTAQLDFYRATAAAYEGQRDRAIAFVQRAEAAFRRLAPAASAESLQRTGAARAETEIGHGMMRGGGLLSLVSDEAAGVGSERDAILGLAEAMRLHATLLQFQGRFAEAGGLAKQTQRVLATSGLSVSNTAARSLRLIAGNQAVSGEFPAAAGTSAEAGHVFEQVTPGERPEALNLLSEGYYLLKTGRPDAALDQFRKAGAILRSPTVQGGVPAYSVVPWLDTLAAASGDRAQLDAEMFEASQFAQSETTAQAIARATAALTAGDPKAAAAVRSFDARRNEVDRLQRERIVAAEEKAPPERLAELDRQIAAAVKARDEAEAAIIAVAPRYRQASEKPVPLRDVQRLLAPDEALASFFVSDNASYGFLVRPSSVTAYKIPLTRTQIAQLVGRLRETTIVKPGGLPTPDFAASYQLYAALFGPVQQQLGGVARVTVAATGDLLRYPLEALVTSPGAHDNNGDYRQVPFLVRRFALSYVPAPRVLVNIRSARSVGTGLRPFIGFGDFRPASLGQLEASFPPQRCGEDARILAGLQRLPDTATQVRTIAGQLGAGSGEMVLGDAFTKARLAQADLGQYRVILLATHGFFPAGQLHCMNDPAITVSPPLRAGNADGEFERPRDIEALHLNADLVALSACDTSGAQAGDSLSGLARSFFLAGARGLLVTHWDVVTGASVPLMIGTFGRLQDSAQALRAAQLQMIDSAGSSAQAPMEISHPNYWAAFVLIGDGIRGGPGA